MFRPPNQLVALKSAAAPVELTAPIVFKDDARRIVYGPVLIPDEPDTDGDVVTADKIESVAHEFLRNYGTIDVQHTLNYVGRPVESYIATQDLTFDTPDGPVVVPKGSWMLGVYVEDQNTWGRVQRGELTGYSIMAVSRAKALKEMQQPKRVTLRDLGEGWVAVAVSLVDRPAVPAAKWVAIKSAQATEVPDLTPVQRTVAALLGIPVAGKESRRISDRTMGLMRTAHDALGELLATEEPVRSNKQKGDDDMEKTELEQVIKQAVEAAIKPVTDRLEAVEKALPTQADAGTQQPTTQQSTTQQPADQEPATKGLLEALDGRLAAVEKAIAPASRQPAGQDQTTATVTKSEQPSRDAFGRRIR